MSVKIEQDKAKPGIYTAKIEKKIKIAKVKTKTISELIKAISNPPKIGLTNKS